MNPHSAFTTYLQQRSYTANTIRAYSHEVKRFLNFVRTKELSELTKADLLDYFSYLKERGNRSNARNRTHCSLHLFFEYLVAAHACPSNLVNQISKVRTSTNRIPTALDFNLIEQCLELIEGKYRERDRTIFALMALSGLRVNEIVQLNKEDYNKDSCSLLLSHRKSQSRLLPIHSAVGKLIEAHLIRASDEQSAMFVSQRANRISVRMVQVITEQAFSALKKKFPQLAGLTISAHTLRHSFATELVNQGVDLLTIQRLMGHSQLSSLQKYGRSRDETMRAAIELIQPPIII